MPGRMLTVRQVAELLNVHPNTVRQWSEKGLMKSYRVGTRGDRRFNPADITGIGTSSVQTLMSTVLIVDDDPGVRELLSDVIGRQGCTTICVESAEEALAEMEKQHCDLVFLDLVLPRLSGLDVLRFINGYEKRTVVAVITGHGDDPVALEAMSLRPMFFIRKPFKVSDIIHVLEATVVGKR